MKIPKFTPKYQRFLKRTLGISILPEYTQEVLSKIDAREIPAEKKEYWRKRLAKTKSGEAKAAILNRLSGKA